ncbi:MAG TPA: YkgJ family cysteine cluster protein [Phycisphaerae bacterium]|nr:YkgJ family cysteine cluster protein [Phycisphaerae bacterium]HOJ75342.1 YkgJ family cysteine cluster protein [Phycisphaerae bacterium]HOM52581.1 YkgJ family cysteine cluster protein [Phycisphaerae bacterium]HON66139.1 YkgJ family cysteine cluster protein [Phycisphaerae bacterium]HOQ87476.1 YkgJ family cysteine cluster protein [Phycisphaerae bacterium]
MRLPILKDVNSLCEQCVALCCRYFAFEIDKPTTKRDFEDLRWYIYHQDTIIFVEKGRWYMQINRPCKELLPDNRCGVYEKRPAICREYTTKNCDWHGDDYDYEHLFTEADQIEQYAKQYLAEQRKRRRTRAKSASKNRAKTRRAKTPQRKSKARAALPVRLLKSA